MHAQNYTPPRVTPTRPTLRQRLCRFARVAWLSFQIWELETYVQRCQRDGLMAGDALVGFRLYLNDLRRDLLLARAS